jgi:hypothetical protein
MRRFYLHLHPTGFYYASVRNPETGFMLPSKSTRTRDRDEDLRSEDSLRIVAALKKQGLPVYQGAAAGTTTPRGWWTA